MMIVELQKQHICMVDVPVQKRLRVTDQGYTVSATAGWKISKGRLAESMTSCCSAHTQRVCGHLISLRPATQSADSRLSTA